MFLLLSVIWSTGRGVSQHAQEGGVSQNAMGQAGVYAMGQPGVVVCIPECNRAGSMYPTGMHPYLMYDYFNILGNTNLHTVLVVPVVLLVLVVLVPQVVLVHLAFLGGPVVLGPLVSLTRLAFHGVLVVLQLLDWNKQLYYSIHNVNFK